MKQKPVSKRPPSFGPITLSPQEYLASKTDIAELKGEVVGVKRDIFWIKWIMGGGFTFILFVLGLLWADQRTLRQDFKTDMSDMKAEIKTDMSDMKAEIKTDMSDMKAEINQRMDRLEKLILRR